ncbi:MAG: DUF4272 domain-containing protein [Cytophagia bacterium]|nr:DUF4272 domain-containing protein [Cytophagia bacterium]
MFLPFIRIFFITYILKCPTVEEEDEVKVRSPKEIAKRLLCLTYLCYAIEDEESKAQVIEFLKKDNLWDRVTDDEKLLFTKPKLTDQERVNVSWRSEAIWLLLWTIKKVDELDLPLDEVNIADIVDRLPKLMSSTKDFIESAEIRATGEILDQSDLIYRLHWATRQAELDNNVELDLNPSIVVERHYAINWVTYYADNWDDITTDT